jgi:alpha-mannosidase
MLEQVRCWMFTREVVSRVGRLVAILSLAAIALSVFHQKAVAQFHEPANLTKQPTLYVVGYAHLDAEWRWEYPQVINEYIRKTMEDNFKLLEKYPHYIFNFSGANRYRFMKEYFAADFDKLKNYVESGRWFPTGSSMEEGDVKRAQRRGHHPANPIRE